MPNVSFMAPGSELEQAQQQAARQQALAQSLRQQSMEQPQGRMVGQYYAAPSWTQSLGKVLQAFAAKTMDDKAMEGLKTARSNYDTRTQGEVADFVKNLRGSPDQSFPTGANEMGDDSVTQNRPAVAPDMNKAMMTALSSQNPMIQSMGSNILTSQVGADMTQQRLAKLLQQLGGGTAPGQSAAVADPSAPPPAGGAPAQPGAAAPSSPFPGVSPAALAMALSGDKGLADAGGMVQTAFAKGNEPVINRGFGVGVMKNGQYVPDPASLDQALAMKRGESGIANENTIENVPNPDGTSRQVTKAQRIKELAPNTVGPNINLQNVTPEQAVARANNIPDPVERANYLKAVAGAGTQRTTTNVGQSTSDHAFANEQGKTLAEYESKINSDAGAAQQKIVQNNKMISMVPDITTGPFSKQVTTLKMLTRNLGVDIGDPSSNQEFEKFAIKGALEGAKQIYGARLTNQDVMSQIMSNPGSTMAEKALYQLINYDTELQQHLLTKQAEYYSYDGPKAQFEMNFNRSHPLMGIGAPKPGQTAQQSAPGAAVPTFTPASSTALKPRPGGGFDYNGKR